MRENPVLYEINTYVWLYELSEQLGHRVTLGNIPAAEWDRLADLGFDYVWLMGIWQRSRAGIRMFIDETEGYAPFASYIDSILPDWKSDDLVGSPFSVAAYEPDPFIGTWGDLDHIREELHKQNIGLILDFVPNHTAPDHPWVLNHPEYYLEGSPSEVKDRPNFFSMIQAGEKVRNLARGWDPFFSPWPDTLQLNHFNPETRHALINELKKIAGHCDGFRCDMSMLVINKIFQNTWDWMSESSLQKLPEHEFWVMVREAVPDSLLMAAAYWGTEWTLQRMGFDYVYDKKLYDCTVASAVGEIYIHMKSDLDFQKRVVRFIENHNEERASEVFGQERLEASAVLFSTLPGMKLYNMGQIEGGKIKCPVQIRRVLREETDEKTKVFYERLLSIIKQDIFHSGQWRLWEVFPMNDGSCGNLIAFTWRLEDQIKLVVVNMSHMVSQGRVPLREMISGDAEYILTDELHGLAYPRNGKEMEDPGLIVILDSYKSHIFNFAVSGDSLAGTD